jgi:hypothetical protein
MNTKNILLLLAGGGLGYLLWKNFKDNKVSPVDTPPVDTPVDVPPNDEDVDTPPVDVPPNDEDTPVDDTPVDDPVDDPVDEELPPPNVTKYPIVKYRVIQRIGADGGRTIFEVGAIIETRLPPSNITPPPYYDGSTPPSQTTYTTKSGLAPDWLKWADGLLTFDERPISIVPNIFQVEKIEEAIPFDGMAKNFFNKQSSNWI